jgi:drug/metabolite transporter (DMT)-like permease
MGRAGLKQLVAPMTNPLFLMIILTASTLVGDYLIKLSSLNEGGLLSRRFLAGMSFYALPAVGWFVLMRSHSLAALGVWYAASTLVLMALLGWLVFEERLTARDLLGLGLAVAAVLVMQRS